MESVNQQLEIAARNVEREQLASGIRDLVEAGAEANEMELEAYIDHLRELASIVASDASGDSWVDAFVELTELFGYPEATGEGFYGWGNQLNAQLDAMLEAEEKIGDISNFKEAAKTLDEAQKALAKLTTEGGVSPEDSEKYTKILSDIFTDYNLKDLEGTEEYISRATELIGMLREAVMTDAANYGDYGKGIIAYFTEVADDLGGDEFKKFLDNVDKLQKAKDALSLLTDETKKKAATKDQIATALTNLHDLFPEIDLTGTTAIEDLTSAVGDFEAEVYDSADACGVLGQIILDAMTRGEEQFSEDGGLADFFKSVSNLSKANESLATFQNLLSGISVDEKQLSEAIESLQKIFPELNLDPTSETFIEDIASAVEQLKINTLDAAGAFPVLGMAIFESMTKGREALVGIDKVASDMGLADTLQKALDTMGDTEGYDQTKSLEAIVTLRDTLKELQGDQYTLGEIPDALQDPEGFSAWLENAKAQAAALIEEIKGVSEAYGILSDAEIEAAESQRKAQEEQEKYIQGMKDLAKSISDEVAANKAAQNGYANQINQMKIALQSGGAGSAVETWKSFNDAIRSGLQNEYPQLTQVLAEIASGEQDATEGAEALLEQLNSAEWLASIDHFDNTKKALQSLEDGTGSLNDAFAEFYKEAATVVEAQDEIAAGNEKISQGAEITTADVQNLSSVLGWTPENVVRNWDLVSDALGEVGTELDDVYAQLQKEAILRIIGTSDADFSNIESGLFSVAADAEETIAALAALGVYEVDEEELQAEMPVFDVVNGVVSQVGTILATGKQKILKFPEFKGGGGGTPKSSSGGGGGGGGSKEPQKTFGSTRVLNTMESVNNLQNNTKNLYQAQEGYYQQTGQLQGVILYREKEIEILKEMNETLELNLEELEEWMDKKRDELELLDDSSEEYQEVAEELEALQSRHQEYTLALINNNTEIESITQSIRDLKGEIRDMEIDVYNEVVKALEARDEAQKKQLNGTISVQKAILDVMEQQKQKSEKMRNAALSIEKLILNTIKQQDAAIKKMLNARISMEKTILSIIQAQAAAASSMQQGRISMENTLIGVIKANIQEQKDAAMSAAQAANDANQEQIEALEKQKELLDEQLRLRKEAAKEQDRLTELAELEAQYSRISADPTRMKEALKIREKIDKLRDEIAWDIAEKEVEAQKKAIDEQIEALSSIDYTAGVAEYYDAMLNDMEAINAQVEEMLDTMSDAEIIEWLKEHSKEYQESTKAGKAAMVEDWQDQLNQMRGVTESFVDEINAVLNGSREEILEWLKENDLEYAKATEAEQQKMVQDWEDMLNEMYGITETHWEKVREVMESGMDGFLEFMEKNNSEYAQMSDTEKEITRQGWVDTWNEMTGEVEDHRDEVGAIMAQGYDAFLSYMMQNSEAFKQATAEEKLSMINSWKAMWDEMNGVTKSYEDEANSIIAQGQEAIIATLTDYTENYANVGEMQSEAYVNSWMEKLAELEAAIASISTLADSVSGDYKYVITKEQIGENEVDTDAANLTIERILEGNDSLVHFAKGGLASSTGPVWVDGTPELPERILNPYETELFEILVSSLKDMAEITVPTWPSFGNETIGAQNAGGLSFGDIIVNVAHLDSDEDYEEMAGHVLNSVMDKINRSTVVGGIRYSR